jgi:predicted DsbA family dithiol-disulfide isomerase
MSPKPVTPKPDPQRIAEELAKVAGTVQSVPQALPPKQGSRTGKVAINSWHDPAVAQQLIMLAAEQGTTQQRLIEEALNMMFAKYGKPVIA